ncbi:MAG: Glyoxalase/bleomycin resistance protein/dioxygenase [Gemmatimonadetes bacterium]|nr:Glyoxalase/bleomycin resistance protein/dioxygenase [Gemmatimonadota bacterium]
MSVDRVLSDPVDDARRDIEPVMDVGILAPGYRLPGAMRLGHVWLQVSNLNQSLTYYESVLGLGVIERDDVSAMLGTIDGNTPLVRLTEQKGAKPMPQQGRLGLYHFAILLPDRPSLARFALHLAGIGARAGASDHLVSEALYLRDPDGLGIEVYADRPRSTWRAVDRQLAMATDPLDFEDLITTAGSERWQGMPAGTTMGHVHLHVGQLEDAATFYHAALGLDKMVWSYPSALFLAAGGYHHHLGLNTWAGPHAAKPTDADARLVEWRIILPSAEDVRGTVNSLRSGGHEVREDGMDYIATDPWDTPVRLAMA